jgi:hypothetical protein
MYARDLISVGIVHIIVLVAVCNAGKSRRVPGSLLSSLRTAVVRQTRSSIGSGSGFALASAGRFRYGSRIDKGERDVYIEMDAALPSWRVD